MTNQMHEFVAQLVAAHPFLEPLHREHMEDQEGELLPHLFMADVVRWVESADSDLRVAVLFDWLESKFITSEDIVQELLTVSFIELLPYPLELGATLRQLLGPRMSERFTEIRPSG